VLILQIGDIHAAFRKPANRLDENYLETIKGKLEQIGNIAAEYDVDVIVQVGDWFDSPEVSKEVVATMEDIVFDWCTTTAAIFGQHDISGHNAKTFKRSPLRVLEASRLVTMLTDKHVVFNNPDIHFYGASFGQPVPVVKNKDKYNVLVIHAMIGDKELYPGQPLQKPRAFLKKHPDYDLVLCGDYHYNFIDEFFGDNKHQIISNAGAVLRKTVGIRDQKLIPGVHLIDTVAGTIKRLELAVEPVERILNLEKEIDYTEDINSRLVEFIESLKNNNTKQCLCWENMLLNVYKDREIKISIQNIISESISEVRGVER